MRPIQTEPLGKIVALLCRAKRPALLVGPGARQLEELVFELARVLGAPIMTTPDAKSMFDEESPLVAGVFSFGASAQATAASQACDVVLALGTELGEFASSGGRAFEQATIVQVVAEPKTLATACSPSIALVDDLETVLCALVAVYSEPGALGGEAAPWFDRHSAAVHAAVATDRPTSIPQPHPVGTTEFIDPSEAIDAIQTTLPTHARVACDVTSAALHIMQALKLGPKRRLWIQLERSACMGSALAVGIGLRLASKLPTLIVIGDWGLMMGLAELHTLASIHEGPLVVLVWSNAGGALIRSGVRAQGILVPVETHTFASPNFQLMARGAGLRALRVRTGRALCRALSAAFRAPFPVLIDAAIHPDAEIPGAEARYLHLTASSAA